MRIHAMTTDRGGCFEHRIALPLAHLGRRGHDTSYGNGAPATVLNELANRPDSVLIGKFITAPQDVAGWQAIAQAPKRPALMVYDCDDSYWDVQQIAGGERSVYAIEENLRGSEAVMRAADLITCTTPTLAARIQEKIPGVPVVVLPNCVADEILDWHVRTPPRKFTIGFQGSPSHLQDMQYWLPAFDTVMKSRPGVMWHWFGLHDPKCWPPHRQRCTPWENSPEQFHRSLNGKFHVGVAPLHPHLPFNRYKSGLKAQVYGALGRPTIASDYPYYGDVIEHGTTGYLCEYPADWEYYLKWLIDDPRKAEKMGEAARELESTRTMSKRVHLWEDAYTAHLP